jgi:hypothetical protein
MVALCAGFAIARPADAQQLRLAIADSAGGAALEAQVEVLLVAWRGVHRVPVNVQNGESSIDVTAAWLRANWPERASDLEKAYIHVRAPGHAAALSRPFQFPGSGGDSMHISFTRAGATLRNGARATLALPLAPAGSKTIRFVDGDDRPVSGVSIGAWMFWSTSNRCGLLVDRDSVGAGVSDAEGRVTLPAGDIEYALVLRDDTHFFQARQSERYARRRLILRLPADETRIVLQPLATVRLELLVTERGSPVSGVTLRAVLADCGCGACDGPLATTDTNGRILIDGFRPEEWSEVELRDATGRVRWIGDPRDWSRGGTFAIRLEAGETG